MAAGDRLAAMRPFRFLARCRRVIARRELAETARRAESMGYSALVIPDHLVEQLAPIPALATIAAATETAARSATFVFNNDLRHPRCWPRTSPPSTC